MTWYKKIYNLQLLMDEKLNKSFQPFSVMHHLFISKILSIDLYRRTENLIARLHFLAGTYIQWYQTTNLAGWLFCHFITVMWIVGASDWKTFVQVWFNQNCWPEHFSAIKSKNYLMTSATFRRQVLLVTFNGTPN